MPSECHDFYLSMSLRDFMVQKGDECIFILAFSTFSGLFTTMRSSLQS